MRKTTYFFAVLLIALGVGAYEMTDRASVTALIPAFLGIILVITATLAAKESMTKHAMHVGVLFALIGFLGSAKGIPAAIGHFMGQAVERPVASITQALMALICLVYIVQCVRWFISNRRKKQLES